MSLDSRMAKIELERRPDGVACVWRNVGETADAAIARWMAKRPGEPDPRKTSAVVLMISWERP